MKSSKTLAQESMGRAADVAVGAVGNAAGASVAPKTAATELRTQATSPALIMLVLGLLLAFLLGRRACREG